MTRINSFSFATKIMVQAHYAMLRANNMTVSLITNIYLFSFLWSNAEHLSLFIIEKNLMNSGKHLLEVFLKSRDILAVANDLEQVLIANEVESMWTYHRWVSKLSRIIHQQYDRTLSSFICGHNKQIHSPQHGSLPALTLSIHVYLRYSLQCFKTGGWATGRASGL